MFDRLDPSFEPSSQTKEAMQYVRKRARLLGGFRHPGLFGIHNYTVDLTFFIVVIAFEGLGLLALGQLVTQRKAPLATAIIIVAAALALDAILAFYHHRFSTGINATLEIENILASKVGGRDGKITVERNNDQIRRRKRISYLLAFALIFAAAAKFAVFFGLAPKHSSQSTAILSGIAVIYFITAIIHINVSGYFVHAGWANWLHDQDIDLFKKSNGEECAAQDHVIDLPSYPDFQKPITVGAHSILSDAHPGGDGPVYMLRCRGLLFDREIEEFCNRLIEAKARSDFVLKAMELQVRML